MPLSLPSKAVSYVIDLLRMAGPIMQSPWLTALLGREKAARTGHLSGEGLTPDQCEVLALMVYWFYEYVEHRISPVALLDVLTNLLAVITKED
jgi:hypothetical protein